MKEFYDKHGFIPEFFNPYNCAEIENIAATITVSAGNPGAVSGLVITEFEEMEN